jgi:glycosyltransferase involved in cell wall biosynthesis
VRILVICHYFYPEIGAPSARILEMSQRWVAEGHEVSVVTCFPNHPTGVIPEEYRGKRFMIEEFQGIRVYRNYVYATPNGGFLKKTIGHLSFMISSVIFSLPRVTRPDVIIVSSPTFFSVISGYLFSLFLRTPFIFEVRDLWPDAVVKLGVLRNRALIKCLEAIEMFLYRRSSKIVVVTQRFKDILCERGLPPNKIEVITNGVDTKFFTDDRTTTGCDLINEYGWSGKRILLYAGAHGISQGLWVLLKLAERLQDQQDVLFVFVGEGAEKKNLQKMAKQLSLSNVQFIDGQPKNKIREFYKAAYLSFVPLRDIPMFESYIPSKMFEILGSACPIVASLSGEAASILRNSGGALVVDPEDLDGLEHATRFLLEHPEVACEMGKLGADYVRRNFSRDTLSRRYLEVMNDLVRGR